MALLEVSAIMAAASAGWALIEGPAKELAKKAGEKVIGDTVGDAVRGLKHRLAARFALPRNHDLVRGLREAYLNAFQRTLDYYNTELRGLPEHQRARLGDDTAFAGVLQEWLDDRLHPVTGSGLDHHAVTQADVEAALDHMVSPATLEGLSRQASAARFDAEQRALEEIRKVWRDGIPPRFLAWFEGRDGLGWYGLFALYVTERIKTDERFRSIFIAAELVDIKRLIEEADRRIADTTAAIGLLDRRLGLVDEKLDALPRAVADQILAVLDARGLTASAADNGLARATILKLAQRLRPDDTIDFDRAVIEVESAVEVAIDLIRAGARGTNHDDFVDAVLRRVAEKVQRSDLDGATRDLDDELAAMDEREERLKRDRVALLESAIQVDLLRRDPDSIARRIQSLVATQHPSPDVAARLSAFEEHYTKYLDEGERRGLNLSLEVAITIARRGLEICRESSERSAWRVKLGIALRTLGERESSTARLEEAVASYRLALEERARERVPIDWAATQNNLGNALRALGMRESGTTRLKEAVVSHRLALEERARERVPLGWAMTQNNLGNALVALGERESGTARLKEAVMSYRAALEERSRDHVPLGWANTQNNLGYALVALGVRESGTASLSEAVTAYRAALEEHTRDRLPLDWAATQDNLGNALRTLGERESGTARLEEAVTAHRAALEERTRDRVPLGWAMTQTNLGKALAALGERGSGASPLEEAVVAYRLALEECTRDRVPLEWARTQDSLGDALSTLGERESGISRLEEAKADYRAALEEFTRDRVPRRWEKTQARLSQTLAILAERAIQ